MFGEVIYVRKSKQDLKNEDTAKSFVTNLITQGLLMLLETNVQVRCREQDVNMVEKCLGEAAKQYTAVIKKETGAERSCKAARSEFDVCKCSEKQSSD